VRTTVTLDPDVHALVQRLMRDRRVSFKQALNDAVRAGAQRGRPAGGFRTTTFRMGEPARDVDKALGLAAELEDEELARRLEQGR